MRKIAKKTSSIKKYDDGGISKSKPKKKLSIDQTSSKYQRIGELDSQRRDIERQKKEAYEKALNINKKDSLNLNYPLFKKGGMVKSKMSKGGLAKYAKGGVAKKKK